MYSVTY